MGTTIAIRKPCSENWNTFEKKGNTRLCSSCRKHVVDFTKFSDKQIIDFFKNNQGKTCGRLLPDQLRTYNEEKSHGFNKAAAMLAAGILALTQAPETIAQTKESSYVLSGRVLDEIDSAITGANVVVKGTNTGISTDQHGNFALEYKSEKVEKLTLVVSYVGYTPLEITRRAFDNDINYGQIAIMPDIGLIGEVCVLDPWYTPRGFWGRIRSIFGK